jgi:predicted transcriptional regulator
LKSSQSQVIELKLQLNTTCSEAIEEVRENFKIKTNELYENLHKKKAEIIDYKEKVKKLEEKVELMSVFGS